MNPEERASRPKEPGNKAADLASGADQEPEVA